MPTRYVVRIAITIVFAAGTAALIAWSRSTALRMGAARDRIASFERSIVADTWTTGGLDDCDAEDVLDTMPAPSAGESAARIVVAHAVRCARAWNAQACSAGVCERTAGVVARRGLAPTVDPSDAGCFSAALDAIVATRALAAGRASEGAVAEDLRVAMETMVQCAPPSAPTLVAARAALLTLATRPTPPISSFVDVAITRDARMNLMEASGVVDLHPADLTGFDAYLDAALALSASLHACDVERAPNCAEIAAAGARRLAETCTVPRCITNAINTSASESGAITSALRAAVVLVDAIAAHAQTHAWARPASADDRALASISGGRAPDVLFAIETGGATFVWTTPDASGGSELRVQLPD